jgi:hypothetical protein
MGGNPLGKQRLGVKIFTFRQSDEHRLSGAEADQASTSQACQEPTFRDFGSISRRAVYGMDRKMPFVS